MIRADQVSAIALRPVLGRCPYCTGPMLAWANGSKNQRAVTRDHIFPKAWGGGNDAENIRLVCNSCNVLRGAAGHCVGVLACVRAVADFGYRGDIAVLKKWQLPQPKDPRDVRRSRIWRPRRRMGLWSNQRSLLARVEAFRPDMSNMV